MHRSKQHLYSIIWSLLPINGLGTVGAVHWKQRTHVPEFFPAGPIAGAVPAVQVDSHRLLASEFGAFARYQPRAS
jgi:hypothetical protein